MKSFVCIVETSEMLGLMMSRDSQSKKYLIQGFESLKDGLRYFEDGYNRNHSRSYEASMSDCINWIFFHPSIVSLDMEEIKALLTTDQALVTCRNVAGSMTLLALKPEAKAVWDSGLKPQLISEDK